VAPTESEATVAWCPAVASSQASDAGAASSRSLQIGVQAATASSQATEAGAGGGQDRSSLVVTPGGGKNRGSSAARVGLQATPGGGKNRGSAASVIPVEMFWLRLVIVEMSLVLGILLSPAWSPCSASFFFFFACF
jgi:hypothetical protein